ncbi:diguanylate cyclase [Sphingomonas sp. BIUV-7]|uniref:diguanylate cyclase n=1 Tax=Sphingomonas natans TaxID=3063330 RepID=A0ABT8Y8U5_9SPHN|nr:sensor domain-containing diguanylate cyclase [Sphingomonas sp. BIUV-7]MDO6414751.1 diguanylate cyclase [Sphingomonas sp. BIUV-7]
MAATPALANEDRAGAFAKATLVGIVYFCAASFSLMLSQGPYGFAPLWPANAILLAAILRGGRRARRYLVAGLVASLAANHWAGGSWPVCAGFTAANLIEPILARRLLRPIFPRAGLSDISGKGLTLFCVVAATAAAVSATVATLFAPGSPSIFFASWFLADFLGMLIITPITIVVADVVRSDPWRRMAGVPRRRAIEAVSLLLMVTLVTLLVFGQSTYPLLFLPLAVMMPVVVRLGTVGASASVLVIAVIAATTTGLGTGPVVTIAMTRLQDAFFVQVYLFVLYAASLPTAALLGAQRRLLEELRENNRLLNLAEAAAQLGHWRLTVGEQILFWSAETYRIHGWDPAGPSPTLADALAVYAEDDRARIQALVETALADGLPYEFRSRICRRDGVVRHVSSRGEIDRGPDGEIIALFGMIQDVTVQSEQESALDYARIAAEESAAAARVASETDSLTGLANRRQLLIVLERARELAGEKRQALAVAILDIDHFKRVNDTYGHVVGDRVLQRVAQAAMSALRGTDMIGRFGGEEFIIVLPNASLDVAETIADRVRAAIAADAIDSFGDWPTVTASLGVAGWQPGETLTGLLQRADEALYDAKRGGRNMVCCARGRVEAD